MNARYVITVAALSVLLWPINSLGFEPEYWGSVYPIHRPSPWQTTMQRAWSGCSSEPIRERTYVRKAQVGYSHTYLVPSDVISQRGTADSIVVPNDELYKYKVVPRQRNWSVVVPVNPF